jgi:DNA repair protein RadA/Sms
MQLDPKAVVFGEIGLSGEIRSVAHIDRRIAEAQKLGFTYAIGPKAPTKSTFLKPTASMRDALNTYLQKNIV